MVYLSSAKAWKCAPSLYHSSTPTLVLCLSFSAEEERLRCNKGIRSRSDQYPLLAPTPERLSCSRNTVTLCHIFQLQYIVSLGTLEYLIDTTLHHLIKTNSYLILSKRAKTLIFQNNIYWGADSTILASLIQIPFGQKMIKGHSWICAYFIPVRASVKLKIATLDCFHSIFH